MPRLVCACEDALSAEQLLRTPSFFLPLLAKAPTKDLAFYSMDTEGAIVYLSQSAEQVTNHDPTAWMGRSFREALTESTCNDPIRNAKCNQIDDMPFKNYSFEIFDRTGKRLQLNCCRVQIVSNGRVIGQTGILQRSSDQSFSLGESLVAKSRLLSPQERQVIDLVFEGRLNKSIAKELAVSMRTVEARRSKSMKKLGAKSVSELIQVWAKLKATQA